MRAFVPGYELYSPKTLAEALERMAAQAGVWRPFAGGTDLMVLFGAGKLDCCRFLSTVVHKFTHVFFRYAAAESADRGE